MPTRKSGALRAGIIEVGATVRPLHPCPPLSIGEFARVRRIAGMGYGRRYLIASQSARAWCDEEDLHKLCD